MIHGLDLFSGIGGLSLALKEYVRTVAYCEINRYAQAVLLSRMQENKIDRAPIWDDIKSLRGDMLPRIDIIFGGFPCQDISVAGRGIGLAGERSRLFFEIVRLAKETRAPFVFLENSPAIRTRGLRDVVGTFTQMGYDCRWTCLSAASIGANHERNRWFMLANANGELVRKEQVEREKCERTPIARHDGAEEFMADSNSSGCLREDPSQSKKQNCDFKFIRESNIHRWINSEKWWEVEPNVGRVVDGFPTRLDRLKCLGNSVVPQQAKVAFEKLAGL